MMKSSDILLSHKGERALTDHLSLSELLELYTLGVFGTITVWQRVMQSRPGDHAGAHGPILTSQATE